MSRRFWSVIAIICIGIFAMSMADRSSDAKDIRMARLAEIENDSETPGLENEEELADTPEERLKSAKEKIVPTYFDETVAFLRVLTELVLAVSGLLAMIKAITWHPSEVDNYGLD